MYKFMKKLFLINMVFLLIFLVIWIFEIICYINNDSILINENLPIIISLVLFVVLIFYIIYNKFKIGFLGVICLFLISGITLLILRDSILFYLPFYHNERFVIRECIVIYYSLLSFIFSIVSSFIAVIYYLKFPRT